MKPERVIVDKDDIIEALETEPLTRGTFACELSCRTCAVGAIIRSAGVTDHIDIQRIGGIVTEGYAVSCPAPKGNYLSALSIVWEHICGSRCRGEDVDDLRPEIVRWAYDNIPDDYEVEIPLPSW